MGNSAIRRRIGALAITCAAAAASAAPANAATVASISPPDDDARFPEPAGVVIQGDRQSNEITVRRRDEAVLVTDSRARVRTGSCARRHWHTVLCDPPDAYYILAVSAGSGDDRVSVRGSVPSGESSIYGEAGDDRIQFRGGVPRPYELSWIDGGGGDDAVKGGARDESIQGGQGSRGDDRLLGGGGDDSIVGARGNDIERGGAGDDVLGRVYDFLADLGKDRFFGGTGNDVIDAADRRRDRRIDCGDGTDLAVIDGMDKPRTKCSRVQVERPAQRSRRSASSAASARRSTSSAVS
jgi:RTX calcium-binding nonapeptide repeat (4 copies)